MTAARRTDKEARRAALLNAALRVFAEKGLANTAVSDIVKAAGVAQGTFYLYFDSKDDVVNGVADMMAKGMVDAIEQSLNAATDASAVAKFLLLRDAFTSTATDPTGRELVAMYHRPENSAVHHAMAERFAPRLLPIVERIVRQGVAEGTFVADDPQVAAWFVLGGLQALENAAAEASLTPAAIEQVTTLALRALGRSDIGSGTDC